MVRNGAREGLSVVAGRAVSEAGSDAESIEYRYTRRSDTTELTASIPDATRLRAMAHIREITDPNFMIRLRSLRSIVKEIVSKDEGPYIANTIMDELTAGYGSRALAPLTNMAYYLPANRTGIMHAHRVVVSSLIGGAPRAGLGPESPLPALSGVLADFLEILIGLGIRLLEEGSTERCLPRCWKQIC